MRPRVIVYKSRGFLSAMSRPLLSDRFDRGTGMRKFFVGIVLAAMIAVSIFAFTACNDEKYVPTAEQGWSASTEWLKSDGMFDSTALLSFTTAEMWRLDVGGAAAQMGDNSNWCQGAYWFEGSVGESPLHMVLYSTETYLENAPDTDPNPSIYDPANIALLDADDNIVEKDVEVVYLPDENGIYTIRARGINAFGIFGVADVEAITMTFLFYPPQDGTLGLGGEIIAVPDTDGLGMYETIGIIVAVVVVVIVAVVVTIVVVKKKKKKKAAALAAGEDAETTYPADDSDEGGGSAS